MAKGKKEMKRLAVILFLILLPINVFGASSRVYPDSYNTSTYDSAGGGEDYTALATWEAATDINVQTTGEVLVCSAGIHDDSVTLDGATTDSNGFRLIVAADNDEGTPTSGVRFVHSHSVSETYRMLYIDEEDYSGFYDLALSASHTVVSKVVIACLVTDSQYNKLVGIICYDCTSPTTGTYDVRGISALRCLDLYVINCVANNVDSGTNAFAGGFVFGGTNVDAPITRAYMYNCTAVNCTVGIRLNRVYGTSNTLYLKNTIAQDNTTNTSNTGSTITQTTNAIGQAISMEADGYHISASDDGNGTDLSEDVSFAFNDDIDGDLWTDDDWGRGCDAYMTAATSQIIWVSR